MEESKFVKALGRSRFSSNALNNASKASLVFSAARYEIHRYMYWRRKSLGFVNSDRAKSDISIALSNNSG